MIVLPTGSTQCAIFHGERTNSVSGRDAAPPRDTAEHRLTAAGEAGGKGS